MAVKLFKLRNVPDDEADDVRRLLTEHEIGFYETTAGGWGVSMPAIWLQDAAQLARATALIEAYQEQRSIRAKAEYEQLKEQGQHRTVLDKISENPVQFVLLSLLSLFILYVSLAPFLQFGD